MRAWIGYTNKKCENPIGFRPRISECLLHSIARPVPEKVIFFFEHSLVPYPPCADVFLKPPVNFTGGTILVTQSRMEEFHLHLDPM